jgi:hypothetical protein
VFLRVIFNLASNLVFSSTSSNDIKLILKQISLFFQKLVVLALVAGLISADSLDNKQLATAGALPYNTLAPQSTAVIYHAQTYETAPKQLPTAPVAAPGQIFKKSKS